MGVYIKGLKMPKKCSNCKFCVNMNEYPFKACFITYSGIYFDIDRLKNCPLAGIKTPHGRLIDEDELLSHLSKDPLFDLVERYGISGVIESRPTILEAEEGIE